MASKSDLIISAFDLQDTVIGLEAMTQFATKSYTAGGKQKVYVRVVADVKDQEFDPITPENSMVLQVREVCIVRFNFFQ